MMKRTMTIWSITLASILALTAVVAAFPFNKSWHESSTGVAGQNRAGAGGIYGTGGRSDKRIKCSHCHIKGEGMIGMTMTANPPFGTVNNESKYTPGTRYTITLAMTGEHKNPGTMNNKNSMAATIENASGQRAGRFIADAGQDSNTCPTANPYPGGTGPVSPAGKTTFMYGDCHGVLPLELPHLTSWTFDWVAPATGAGDLTLYIGMVDGDTDGSSSLKDDTLERSIPLHEGP
jgi:hypothetical protein